jgi:hypothetical protein
VLNATDSGVEKGVPAVIGVEALRDRDRGHGAGHGFAFGLEHAALQQFARQIVDEGRHRAHDGRAANVVAESERGRDLGARFRQHLAHHGGIEQRDGAGAQIDRRQHHVGLAAGRRHHEVELVGGARAADAQRRLLGGDPDPDGGGDRDQQDEQQIGTAVAGDGGAHDQEGVHGAACRCGCVSRPWSSACTCPKRLSSA